MCADANKVNRSFPRVLRLIIVQIDIARFGECARLPEYRYANSEIRYMRINRVLIHVPDETRVYNLAIIARISKVLSIISEENCEEVLLAILLS